MNKREPASRNPTITEPGTAHVYPGGEIVLYEAPDGQVRLDVRLEQESIWLSLNQMATL